MSIQLLLCVALSVSSPTPVTEGRNEPPPGMLLVKGGTTKIGTPAKEIEAFGMENEIVFPSLVPETPQHSVRVEDFFLMVSEVTNEQYAAFVQATGARPPWTWGEEATNEARKAFLEDQQQRKQAALDAGQMPPERRKFEPTDWWRKNWEGQEWEVPAGKEARPATFVDYQDARGYARWAGLRLMTEFEYQRACRGNTAQRYPWGDDGPDRDKCASLDSRINEPLPAGALPDGASEEGIHHLAGNVWEWTGSPFTSYPKYEDLKIKVGKGRNERTVPGIVKWDANQRVAVGGSFQTSALACRTTTRRPTDRTQMTDALGFRCAGSVAAGLDIARVVMKEDLPLDTRPEDVEFDETKVLAMDRWTGRAGSVSDVPGYGVVADYNYVLFVPCVEVDAVSVKGLKERSLENGVVTMGVLSTTIPVVEPALPPGTYYLSFRASGEAPPPADPADPDAPAPLAVPEGYDWAVDNFIFYSWDDVPVAAWPAATADLTYSRPKRPEIVVGKATREIPGTDDEGEPIVIEDPVDVAAFKVNSWVRVSNKGFHYSLRLMFAPGAITEEGWRN